MVRRRLDSDLVRRGLAGSRAQARALVEGRLVLVGGAVADKPGRLVAEGDAVVVRPPARRYASRGGDKLAAALERFALDVRGRRALDAGASTGGFTDCLLQHGAAHVVAVDVGYGQLDPSLRDDQRVTVLERTNVRHLGPDDTGGPADVVVADLSFISLTTVVPALAGPLAGPDAAVVLLVKPQFESGRVAASRGRGVIRDPALRRQALAGVASALLDAGATIMGAMASPVLGPAGNAEFLLYARAHATGPGAGDRRGATGPALEAMIDEAVAGSPDAVEA